MNRIGASWYKSRFPRPQRLFSGLYHPSTSLFVRTEDRYTDNDGVGHNRLSIHVVLTYSSNAWIAEGKVCRVYSFSETWNERSRERMVPRTKVPSWERMFQGTNSLENEYSSIQMLMPRSLSQSVNRRHWTKHEVCNNKRLDFSLLGTCEVIHSNTTHAQRSKNCIKYECKLFSQVETCLELSNHVVQ